MIAVQGFSPNGRVRDKVRKIRQTRGDASQEGCTSHFSDNYPHVQMVLAGSPNQQQQIDLGK